MKITKLLLAMGMVLSAALAHAEQNCAAAGDGTLDSKSIAAASILDKQGVGADLNGDAAGSR